MNDQTIKSYPDLDEAMKDYFTNVGPDLASTIPQSSSKPEDYKKQTTKVCSFKNITSNTVLKHLLKLDVNKATGLDNIPSYLD